MAVRIALAGDTMLGRGVAERLAKADQQLFAPEIRAAVADADLFLLNLECCVSQRGRRWPDPDKPFFFRAPPSATKVLAELGVDCVTLANNHALDFGVDALADTLGHLKAAGIRAVGAGRTVVEARRATVFETCGLRVAVLGVTDHPAGFAAGEQTPGVAYADLRAGTADWLVDRVRRLRREADIVLVTPHWGPNMTTQPPPYVRHAAATLVDAGATVLAGHSAHVFHGVAGRVLYDLGDFIDDYVVHPQLRNDLGLLFLLTVDEGGPTRLEAMPIALDYCHTRAADPTEYQWVRERFSTACAAFGTAVEDAGGRLIVRFR